MYDNRGNYGPAVRARQLKDPSATAVHAEAQKRNRKLRGTNMTREQHLKTRNISFAPLGFTVAGVAGATWSSILKKISDHAASRKGHNAQYFRRRWTVRLAMTLAKRGAAAALRRARAAHRELPASVEDCDILGAQATEAVLTVDEDYEPLPLPT